MRCLLGLMIWLAVSTVAGAADEPREADSLWNVRFRGPSASNGADEPMQRSVTGRVLVQAIDGGLLVEDRAGTLWNITPEELLQSERTHERFTYLSGPELATVLLAELGDRFQTVHTEHYVIATSGNLVHAQWCGTLFERLLQAFLQYWHTEGLELSRPGGPLPVVVHRTRDEYAEAVRAEAGTALIGAHGYYSMRTNRIVLVDITSHAKIAVRTEADMRRVVAADSAPVSTIVHEATHQIAFNSGMHTRYADNPVWLTEGMAMLFEVPDLGSRTGWRTIGRTNRPRLFKFKETFTERRAPASLDELVADDERFRDPATAEAAYAEAWTFTLYLMKSQRREYVTFLRECSKNSRLVWKTRTERLEDFRRAFGVAPAELEDEMLHMARRLR